MLWPIPPPAISFRRALVYPSCDTDRSTGAHRGRLYCSWMDLTASGATDIFASYSDDRGATWSTTGRSHRWLGRGRPILPVALGRSD